jgi:hypothetical protein
MHSSYKTSFFYALLNFVYSLQFTVCIFGVQEHNYNATTTPFMYSVTAAGTSKITV